MSPRIQPCVFICLALMTFFASLSWSQKSPSSRPKSVPATGLAKACEDPYSGQELKTSWPELPVYLLFKRANSKVWAPNPQMKLPQGMRAATPAAAHALVCVQEERLEMGRYESGAKAYTPSWDVYVLRLPDAGIYFQKTGIFGGNAPSIKWHPGAGVGSQPVSQLQEWLRLLFKHDVARLKARLPYTSSDKVRQMALSGDRSRLVVAHQPYHYSTPQPDLKKSPLVTVFDVASGKRVAEIPIEEETSTVAISDNGELVATERYGHAEIWNVSSHSIVQKLSTPTGVRWLAFGADGNLGVGTQKQVAVIDPRNGNQLFSCPGSRITYENGRWIAVSSDGTSIYDVKTGQPIAHFPAAEGEIVASADGLSEITMAVLRNEVRWAGKKSEYIDVPSIGSEGTGHVSAIANSSTGFVVGTNDGIVILLSATGSPKLFATDHSRIDSLVVSRDGKLLAIGDSSGKVTLWELQ